MSAHSTIMGSQYKDNQSVAMSRKEGSMYSGRGSNFVRGENNQSCLVMLIGQTKDR